MRKNVVMDKSYVFALEIIDLYKFLKIEKREFVISKQILRSGTAIGALIKEAEHAQSKADFLNKMNVSLKEANETTYWIDLLKDSGYLTDKEYKPINASATEILRLLISIVKTTKANLNYR